MKKASVESGLGCRFAHTAATLPQSAEGQPAKSRLGERATPVERAGAGLFTIGHSNHAVEHLLELLRRHQIDVVADVRSRPYSRFVPHFSRERLARLLEEAGIGYLYLGGELGGKPPRGEAPATALDYPDRIRQPKFQGGVERLLTAARERRVALLCRERDPLDCHRLHLICRYVRPLVDRIGHILPDGALETQEATERRLLERVSTPQGLLFEPGDPLERAYDDWWHRGH
jgi:hypothetical protein